ncbi:MULTISPECIES: FAD-dependent monooxygenase [unclassified Mesorhizobium]
MESTTPIVIVGGRLNSLTAASLLSHQGVSCMVVERHSPTSGCRSLSWA